MTKKPEAERDAEELVQQAMVPEEKQPYQVPANWVWVRLKGAFFQVRQQFNPLENERCNYIGLEHLKKGGGIDSVSISTELKSQKNCFIKNDLLYGKLRPYLNKHAVVDFEGIVSTDIVVLRPNGVMSSSLLDYYLNLPLVIQYAVANSKGINLPRISPIDLEGLPMPLPPLPEQQRIVSAIESLFAKLDRARELLEEVQEAFEEQKATILARAFRGELTAGWREEHKKDDYDLSEKMACANPKLPGDSTSIFEDESIDIYFEIPNTWKWMRMRDCCEKFQYGTSEKSEAMGKMPVLRMGNLQNGEIVWDDLVYSSNALEIEKYRLKKNDILFNRTNSPELVGKTAIYKNEMEAIFAGYLIRVRANSNMDPNYINFYLNSIYAKKKCQIVKTDGVSQSNINAAKLGSFEIPVAPLAEQQEIIRILDDLLDQSSAAAILCDQLEQIDQLKKTILAKAFRGELDTNDPAEESAEKLLRDVLQQRAAVGAGKAKAKRMPLEAEQP